MSSEVDGTPFEVDGAPFITPDWPAAGSKLYFLFGEKYFDRDIRTADAVSASDTVLYKIKHLDFKRFLFNHPQSSLEVLWNIIGEVTGRLFKARQHLVTIFETGKIVGGHLGLSEITEKILSKLLEQIQGATGGMMIIRNRFTDSHEVASAANMTLLDLEGAVQLTENDTGGCICHSLQNGVIMVVPLRDEDSLLGHILLEKKDQSEPFSVEEEIIVSAVGDQVGLGIMSAYNRQEEEARQRLEQSRMKRY